MASGDMKGAVLSEWMSLVGKYGFAAGIAVALLGYMAFYIVAPMRDDQKAFMQSVIKTNELNASTHATALSTLVDQQKQTTAILQQIRDDQRAGAWRDSVKHP